MAVVLIFALAGQALDYVVSTIFSGDFALRDSVVLSDVLLAMLDPRIRYGERI